MTGLPGWNFHALIGNEQYVFYKLLCGNNQAGFVFKPDPGVPGR